MSAYQVNKRHQFLEWLLHVKKEEEDSYNNMNTCVITLTSCIFLFSVLEILFYFIYLFQVWLQTPKRLLLLQMNLF